MNPKKLSIILIAILIISGIIGSALYYLSHASLSRKIDQLEKLQVDIQVAQIRNRKLADVVSEYKGLADLDAKLDRVLPNEKQQSEVAAQLFAIISETGMTTEGISFEATTGLPGEKTQTTKSPVSNVLVMPVSFSLEGNYAQLLNFLDAIERLERISQVQSLEISRGVDALRFDLKLGVYLQP